VVPAQLAHNTFLVDGQYQPVRAVSTKAPYNVKGGKDTVTPTATGSKSATVAIGLSSAKYTGGGGILIFVDKFPDKEAEFIEFNVPVVILVSVDVSVSGQNGHAIVGPAASGPHIALDENMPEAV